MWLAYICEVLVLTTLTISRPAELESKLSHSINSNKNLSVVKKDYRNVDLPPIGFNFDHPHAFNLMNDGSGTYYFSFRTPTYERAEQGILKNVGTENELQVIKGQYVERFPEIPDTQGFQIIRTIGYIADESGYHSFLINSKKIQLSSSPPYASYSPPAVVGDPKGKKLGSTCFAGICPLG